MAFKTAASLAYKAGLPQANPVILEPIGTLKVQVPAANIQAAGNAVLQTLFYRGEEVLWHRAADYSLLKYERIDVALVKPRVAYRETIRKKVRVQGKHKKQSGGHGQDGEVWVWNLRGGRNHPPGWPSSLLPGNRRSCRGKRRATPPQTHPRYPGPVRPPEGTGPRREHGRY